MPYKKVALAVSFQLQQAQQFLLQRRQISPIQLPQRLQKPLHRFLQPTRIHPMMRSPTVGACAIADYLHLFTLVRQVIVGLQVLQANRVLAIPGFDGATEFAHHSPQISYRTQQINP